MKRIILFIVCCTALLGSLRAQEDSKYLLGAVPVGEDGLVHFTTSLKAPALTQLELYNVMKDWANNYFKRIKVSSIHAFSSMRKTRERLSTMVRNT